MSHNYEVALVEKVETWHGDCEYIITYDANLHWVTISEEELRTIQEFISTTWSNKFMVLTRPVKPEDRDVQFSKLLNECTALKQKEEEIRAKRIQDRKNKQNEADEKKRLKQIEKAQRFLKEQGL